MIVRVNRERFLEVKKMCQALEELMADELEDMRKKDRKMEEKKESHVLQSCLVFCSGRTSRIFC